jgi:hypothetical protein
MSWRSNLYWNRLYLQWELHQPFSSHDKLWQLSSLPDREHKFEPSLTQQKIIIARRTAQTARSLTLADRFLAGVQALSSLIPPDRLFISKQIKNNLKLYRAGERSLRE